ncbi:hypothetical protein QBC35DRAFT_535969 [Podospora australis]|uniref:Uncharacterized protein n=1 Tax=Podospora australis TaxID=1536484 RepID=A0AAN6WJ92_9PEZI|nr:hypothetical protein QBC35DRAFT_535969 [Podospora australis]
MVRRTEGLSRSPTTEFSVEDKNGWTESRPGEVEPVQKDKLGAFTPGIKDIKVMETEDRLGGIGDKVQELLCSGQNNKRFCENHGNVEEIRRLFYSIQSSLQPQAQQARKSSRECLCTTGTDLYLFALESGGNVHDYKKTVGKTGIGSEGNVSSRHMVCERPPMWVGPFVAAHPLRVAFAPNNKAIERVWAWPNSLGHRALGEAPGRPPGSVSPRHHFHLLLHYSVQYGAASELQVGPLRTKKPQINFIFEHCSSRTRRRRNVLDCGKEKWAISAALGKDHGIVGKQCRRHGARSALLLAGRLMAC